jgi:hypothetical protein
LFGSIPFDVFTSALEFDLRVLSLREYVTVLSGLMFDSLFSHFIFPALTNPDVTLSKAGILANGLDAIPSLDLSSPRLSDLGIVLCSGDDEFTIVLGD